MGRLRSDREAQYFCDIAKEVTDLFGTTDATLYRYWGKEQENLDGKDPLWDEPTTTAFFEPYNLAVQWFNFATTDLSSPAGRNEEADAEAYVTIGHLVQAGVPRDPDGEYVAVGDTIAIHTKCGHETIEYDILQTNRDGWVNSSDKFTGYILEIKRRNKYVPERKTR